MREVLREVLFLEELILDEFEGGGSGMDDDVTGIGHRLERVRVHVLDLHCEHVHLRRECRDRRCVAEAAGDGAAGDLTGGGGEAGGVENGERDAQAGCRLRHHTPQLTAAQHANLELLEPSDAARHRWGGGSWWG